MRLKSENGSEWLENWKELTNYRIRLKCCYGRLLPHGKGDFNRKYLVAVFRKPCLPPQFLLTEYLWSEWITQIWLQFDAAALRSETLVHKSLVTGNFIDLDDGFVLIKSRWNPSSKNLLGNNYAAGIKDPKTSFSLVSKNLKTAFPSGLWITLLASENANFGHNMSWARVGSHVTVKMWQWTHTLSQTLSNTLVKSDHVHNWIFS